MPSRTTREAPTSRLLIVHASSELYGSDRACLTIATAAAKANFDTHVVVPADGPLVPLLESAGAAVHILDPLVLRRADLRGIAGLHAVASWPKTFVRLRRFASITRFDIVHSHCMPTLGGSLLAHWWKVPHIWHVHELFASSPLARVVFELFLSQADIILAASGAVSAQLRNSTLQRRCRVAYTGGEVTDDIKAHAVTPLRRARPAVVCVGRLNRWKGQDVLIHAIGVLRDRAVDVRLQLVGDVYASEHRYRQGLEALITQLALRDHVALLGQRQDAHEIIANADIVVVPSTEPEPFGIVVVEAMALGRPLVATAAGGPAEIITPYHDGLLVPPGDADALANAIGQLIQYPDEARRLGSNAMLTARRFTPHAMAEHVIAVYQQLLGTNTCTD